MNFTLRQGNLEDIETVYRLNRESFAEYWSRESLFSALESDYDLLFCEADGQPVAYLLSLTVCGEIQIMQIAVSPAYRRHGLARRMTETLLASINTACTVTLEVR
ncbi:MAG: N-acetyltransferase, partial [Mariprofundus sp.]|nr:N-acetyltransferase [Mariprofundus sp.]